MSCVKVILGSGDRKAVSLQSQFMTVAVCCFNVSLSVYAGEVELHGSSEANHTELERNDHLSLCDSEG